jgi:hypothetical protein
LRVDEVPVTTEIILGLEIDGLSQRIQSCLQRGVMDFLISKTLHH